MTLKKLLNKIFLPDSSKWYYWVFIALLIKALFPFLAAFFRHRTNASLWGFEFGPDVESYFDPIENFIKHGRYDPDHRMPGYGIIHLCFRQFIGFYGSCNLIGFFQLIISSLSVYYMALCTQLILKSNKAFYLCFYIFLVSTYSNYYDLSICTESLCTSFLVFSAYFFTQYFFGHKARCLLFSGIFLTWAIFMRPVFAPIFLVLGVIIVLYSLKHKKAILRSVFILILPFVITDGVWVYRNYTVHHKFAPFFNDFFYPYFGDSYLMPMCNFVQSWGGARYMPDGKSAMSWFGGTIFPNQLDYRHYDSIPNYYDTIPDDIYTSVFNRDSLLKLRSMARKFIDIQKVLVDSLWNASGHNLYKAHSILYEPLKPRNSLAAKYQEQIISKFKQYTQSIKKERPFIYYIKGPLVMTYKFLFVQDEGVFVFKRNTMIPGAELFYHLFYLAVLDIGLLGIILLIIKGFKSDYLTWTLASIPAYTIIVHPMLLRAGINRYLMPAWPFVIACAVYVIVIVYEKMVKNKGITDNL